MKKFFLGYVLLSGGALYAQESPFLEVKKVAQEILSHHFQYKELTAELLERSCKFFLYQLDEDGSYLLEKEALPYLSLPPEKAAEILLAYHAGKFPTHLSLRSLFTTAIQRARRARAHLRGELIQEAGKIIYSPSSRNSFFARNEQEQLHRTRELLQGWLFRYAQEHGKEVLDSEERFLVLQFHEKKRRAHEEKFLGAPVDHHASSFSFQLLKALATSLDPDTKVYEREEAEGLKSRWQKRFFGLGMTLTESVRGVLVTKVLQDSPAERADVRVHDLLLAIDDKDISCWPFQEVLKTLQGSGNLPLRLLLERPNKKKVQVELASEEIVQKEERVTLASEPFINGVLGIFSIPSFYEGAFHDIQKLLKKLKKEAPLYGIILDLRSNQGGLLEEALQIETLFTTSQVLALGEYCEEIFPFRKRNCWQTGYRGPLLILTSTQTAASAELLAQALREAGLCIIVGDERTFGQAAIQRQTVTQEGVFPYQVTIGRLLSPSGQPIKGVTADIVVPTLFAKHLKRERPPLCALQGNDTKGVDRLLSFLPPIHTPLLQMVPRLLENSAERLKEDRNFQAFLRVQNGEKRNKEDPFHLSYGKEDLSLKEARNILKDAILLSRF